MIYKGISSNFFDSLSHASFQWFSGEIDIISKFHVCWKWRNCSIRVFYRCFQVIYSNRLLWSLKKYSICWYCFMVCWNWWWWWFHLGVHGSFVFCLNWESWPFLLIMSLMSSFRPSKVYYIISTATSISSHAMLFAIFCSAVLTSFLEIGLFNGMDSPTSGICLQNFY